MALLLFDDRRRKATVRRYLLSLNPLLYYFYNESSGNLLNYGSESGAVGVVSGATQGQAGQLGAGEAYLFDGVDDVVTVANATVPNVKALTTQRWVFLINAASLGEGNNGTLFSWNTVSNNHTFLFRVNNSLLSVIQAATTSAMAIAANGTVTFLGSWALVALDYDDTNALGLGRRIRLFWGTAATPMTLATLTTNDAAVGAVTVPSAALRLGNNQDGIRSFSGLVDFVAVYNTLWSPAGTPADITALERVRQLTFGV